MEDSEQQRVLDSLQNLHLHNQEDSVAVADEESYSWPSVGEVEENIIGYKFRDPGLLEQALTHCSYKEGSLSYERLEYVGDSVLNLLIAKELYFSYPHLPPGKLTRLRAANVNTEKLARVAVNHHLYRYLRHKKPLLEGQIRQFKDAIQHYPLHSSGLIDPPKDLADIVESVIGAIFIDSDFSMEITWKVMKDILKPIISLETMETHPVTKLYELCQKHGFKVKFVDLWKETGEVKAFINDELIGTGIYGSKKLIAVNRAAHNAYNEIVKKLSLEDATKANDASERKIL